MLIINSANMNRTSELPKTNYFSYTMPSIHPLLLDIKFWFLTYLPHIATMFDQTSDVIFPRKIVLILFFFISMAHFTTQI